MSDSTPSETAATSTPREQRVSTLVGDRLCIRCSYNLIGQPVLREGHYHMLIVRCPECGTVASLQEHPLLGRWATRWAVVLAGLWLAVLLGAWVATTLILHDLANQMARQIARSTWFIAVAEFGPGSVLLIFAMGCLWSLLLPHVRRPWLPLAAVVLISLPAYFAYLDQRLSSLQLFALLTAAFPLIFGLLLGRTIARLAVRAILPPRLRSSLAGLWTIDGLAPPPGARLNA